MTKSTAWDARRMFGMLGLSMCAAYAALLLVACPAEPVSLPLGPVKWSCADDRECAIGQRCLDQLCVLWSVDEQISPSERATDGVSEKPSADGQTDERATPDSSEHPDASESFARDADETSAQESIFERPPARCGDGICEQNENCATCPNDCACASGERCEGDTCKKAGLCGNGLCDNNQGENCATCPNDCHCGIGQICENGQCNRNQACGDGTCDPTRGENCATCPNDCACPTEQRCDPAIAACKDACGNGVCEPQLGEDCATCSKDCACQTSGQLCLRGSCVLSCGNGQCDSAYGEDCTTCPKDCACPSGALCQAGRCGADCGNGVCNTAKGENCSTCPTDCTCDVVQFCQSGQCLPWCGNGLCEAARGETCDTCPVDCACPSTHLCQQGICRSLCGNGVCDTAKGENCSTCPTDCTCNATERCANGKCECAPQCAGKTCGSNGCGGSCGTCPPETKCVGDLCVCEHQCPPQTDAVCKKIDQVERCEANQQGCRLLKTIDCRGGLTCKNGSCCGGSCTGRTCGDDGCGGSCGACPKEASCINGKCICQNSCQLGQRQCINLSPDKYEECVSGLSGCPQWAQKACGPGKECANGQCCAPCGTKECGTNDCGVPCGSCSYLCAQGQCARKVVVRSVRIPCGLCTDTDEFNTKPDLYLRLTLADGTVLRSDTKIEAPCNASVPYNWHVRSSASAYFAPHLLKSVKVEAVDWDIFPPDDVCTLWDKADLTKPGTILLKNPQRAEADIEISK